MTIINPTTDMTNPTSAAPRVSSPHASHACTPGLARWLLMLVALLCAGMLRAQESPRPRPLAELLGSDGALKLPAGYNGPLDPSGWRLVGQENGALRFTRSDAGESSMLPTVPDDVYWDDVFGDFSIDGDIQAMAVDGENVYIGGLFNRVSLIDAHHVALWNGSSWQRLGEGTDGNVYALAVSEGRLYVGGEFRTAGGIVANRIALWSGVSQSWSPLGSGIDDPGYAYVGALAVNGGDLYAGGGFRQAGGATAGSIASWNSATRAWSAMGGGVDGDVQTIVTKGDAVYAGGSFTTAGGEGARNIAQWSRSSSRWSPLGAGIHGWVGAIGIAPDGRLYVGGRFDSAGTVRSTNLAVWGNGQWVANKAILSLHVPLAIPTLRDTVTVLDSTIRGIVVANDGSFILATWMRALGGYANAVAISSNSLYIGGTFRSANNGAIKGRIFRNEIGTTTWRTFGNKINAPVTAMTVHGGEVWVAGGYDIAGKTGATSLVKWDGSGWTQIVGGVKGIFRSLLFDGDELYVGGEFTLIGSVGAENIAKLNIPNNLWSALDEGVSSGDPFIPCNVNALTLKGRDLYAGGEFLRVGSAHTPANNIARWNIDQSRWYPVENDFNGGIHQLAFSPSGDLYAGGSFSSGDRTRSNLSRWDGARWNSVGGGVDGDVNALLFSGNDLIIGGEFKRAGGDSVWRIARWDGTRWNPYGRGVEGTSMFPVVMSLGMVGNDLFAAGTFALAGGDSIANVARWDGSRWWPLGSGTDNSIDVMAIIGRDLFVSGSFLTAGAKPSVNFAHWTIPILSVDVLPTTPGAGMLGPNVPNPVERATTIHYRLDHAGDLSLALYDALGRRIASLFSGRQSAGEHEVVWDADGVPAGAYFCRIELDGRTETRGMIVR